MAEINRLEKKKKRYEEVRRRERKYSSSLSKDHLSTRQTILFLILPDFLTTFTVIEVCFLCITGTEAGSPSILPLQEGKPGLGIAGNPRY